MPTPDRSQRALEPRCQPPLAPPFQTGEASWGGRRSSAHRSSFHYSLFVGQAGHHTASPLEKKGGNGRGKPPAWEAGRLPGPPQDAGPLVSKAAWGRAGGRDPPTLSTGEERPGAGLPRGGPRAAVSHGCWRGEQEGLASPARGAWKSRLSRQPHRATSRRKRDGTGPVAVFPEYPAPTRVQPCFPSETVREAASATGKRGQGRTEAIGAQTSKRAGRGHR